jgi:5-methylcytosine-specific restriction enzyme subunit McrC
MHYLVRDKGVKTEHKTALNKLLVFFDGVSLLEPSSIEWGRLHYQRNNKNYEMLLNICYFVLDGMLQTTDKGDYKMATFSDEHMARLYEKFILEYYRQHHTYLSEARAAQVKWDLQGENDESMIRFLPVMQTDIFLRLNEKILILDAKYYGRTLQKQFDKYTLHSGNVYQIFTYVKNQDKTNSGNVAGILVYAKTGEDITPDCVFNMGGNQIGAKTLDLNKDFNLIAAQLDAIAAQFFGKVEVSLMNTAMFLQTMLEVLKYDSKFKDKKSGLLPILRRAKINNLPQWEFVRGGRSGQRYENVELRVPVPLLDEANAAFDDLYELIEYVYEESDDYGLGGVPIRPQILSPDQVEYKEHDVVFTEIQETIIQGIRDAKYTIWAAVAWLSNQAIIDELLAKKKQGVHVRLIISKKSSNKAVPISNFPRT